MQFIIHIILIILAYLLGSIPSAVWIGKWFYNTDVREHGSGNPGFTNTIRVIGWKAGLPVFFIDILKGWIAVYLIYLTNFNEPKSGEFITIQLVLGSAAVLGHIFPVFAGFKGGKGVATLLGVVIAINPIASLICIGIFLITLLISKYVSLSSIMAGISFPFVVILIFKTTTVSLIIFSLIVTILLIITHRRNIGRLIRNEESKVNFRKKSKL
jgi:glycerol-3-phosphate acyltransferase PlsY